MTNFPNGFDDDTTLPFINDNITQEGGAAINALRDVAFAMEQYLGLGAAGTTNSIAARLGVSLNPDGTINPSAITSLGLVTLPITQNQIAANAMIPESKLMLDHRTQDLFNYIRDLSKDINQANGWISISGAKLEPHLIGAIYRHVMNQIDVTNDIVNFPFMLNKFRLDRDNTQSFNLVNDINNELLFHQWADGYPAANVKNVITTSGTFYPSNYAHYAGGIFINPSRFQTVPQTAQDLQSFAEFVDGSSILLLGTRIQNLYANGISRNSRSSSLTADGYGQSVVPATPAIAYLLGTGNNASPTDDINTGDDIIEFKPTTGNSFDEQFSLVRVGDIVRINYGTVEVQFVILEKKYIQNGPNKKYVIRIAGKNLKYAPTAVARIDRPLFNNNKYGVLATSAVNGIPGISGYPASLIVSTSRGAQALGIGFSPDEFNETHFLLYLALYPDGSPSDGYTILPPIDVTGNLGTTPGSYTLDSIVAATNAALRQPGYNYRFTAFQYQGNFGIMLADSYNNASFSIISAIVDNNGLYNQAATQLVFPNNVVDLFPTVAAAAPDPLGFGPFGANIASPPFQNSYNSTVQAIVPTRLFVPLKRNNYYVDGAERERMSIDVGQILDSFGDGYWFASIVNPPIVIPGPNGRVETTYVVNEDLSTSQLKAGKTIVVQSLGHGGTLIDFGRYIIQSVVFSCNPVTTSITLYDAVHAQGFSPAGTLGVGGQVALYFNSDSVAFDAESATDFISVSPFKRHFEVYIDENGDTFTHERGRLFLGPGTGSPSNVVVNDSLLYTSTTLSNFDIVKISPKLRGYQFGSVNKINFSISSYDATSGVFTGFLSSYNGITFSRQGPITTGKRGEITRFYDETTTDYIDFRLDINSTISSFTNQSIDIQLFPSLSLDEEIMLISTCQLNDSLQTVTQVVDQRQFGNVSEEELTTSALNFISLPDRLLHFNGVVRGFDISNITNEFITINGGLAMVNGNFQFINQQVLTIPKVKESFNSLTYPINFALCVNSIGELITIPLTDFDSVLGTPNSPTRLVSLFNVVSSTTYNSDADTFSYILNNRKDLTILYVISSVVTGTGPSATVALTSRDVRRFINDSDASIPAVLTSDSSQGNFKTLASSLNWLKFNSAFQNTLQIKGSFTLPNDPGLNFPLNIVGAGSTSSLTFNSGTMVMSNVTFNNVAIVFNGVLEATNVTFNNCNITFNSTVTASSNLTFNNCTITAGVSSIFFLIPNLTINGSTVNSNANILFALSNNTVFEDTTFNYNANAVTSGFYNTNNLVNSNGGLIWIALPGFIEPSVTLTGLTITGCTFNNPNPDHFPFISLQLSALTAVVEDVYIANNQFNNLSGSNDFRAVVALTSTLTSAPGGGAYPKFPKIVNVIIENNICNNDQLILVSTDRISGQPIVGSMLNAVNCRISSNTCGTIGFITSGSEVSHPDNTVTANGGFVRNKPGQLIINNNSCKLITNLDSTGAYIGFAVTAFPVPSTNTSWVQAGTGPYAILNNTVNWIQTGCSSYTSLLADGATITGNRLFPNDPVYLNKYVDTNQSGVAPYNAGIILRIEAVPGGTTQSIISNNVLIQKPISETTGGISFFFYLAGIVCFNNAQIINNTIMGVVNSPTDPIIQIWSTGTTNVQGNILNRLGLNTQAYVAGVAGATNAVKITNNIFDSQFTDIANTIEQSGVNIPQTWTFNNNKNQVYYVEMPLLDYNGAYSANNPNTSTIGAGSTSFPASPLSQIFFGDSNNFAVQKMLSLSTIGPGNVAIDSQYLVFQDSSTATPADVRATTVDIPIDRWLPPGTRILNAKLGVYCIGANSSQFDYTTPSGGTSTYNAISVLILQYNNILTSSSTNGVLDVKANLIPVFLFSGDNSVANIFSGTYYINNSGQESNLKANTQYITVDLSGQTLVTGNNYRIAAEINVSYKRTTPGVSAGAISLILSPLVVKCIYE